MLRLWSLLEGFADIGGVVAPQSLVRGRVDVALVVPVVARVGRVEAPAEGIRSSERTRR